MFAISAAWFGSRNLENLPGRQIWFILNFILLYPLLGLTAFSYFQLLQLPVTFRFFLIVCFFRIKEMVVSLRRLKQKQNCLCFFALST